MEPIYKAFWENVIEFGSIINTNRLKYCLFLVKWSVIETVYIFCSWWTKYGEYSWCMCVFAVWLHKCQLFFLQKLQGFLWNTHTLEALYKIALQLESNQSPWMHEQISTTEYVFLYFFWRLSKFNNHERKKLPMTLK